MRVGAPSDHVVRTIQGALNRIATEVKEHHRDALEKLLECVREINATSE